MSEVLFSDRLAAFRLSAVSHVRHPDDIRVTPLSFWPVRGVSTDNVRGWAEFEGMPPEDADSYVGTIAAETSEIKELWGRRPDAQIGIAQAVRGAVVFGQIPRGLLNGPNDLPANRWYQFAVRLGRNPVQVMLALRSGNRLRRVPEYGEYGGYKTDERSIGSVVHEQPRVRIYQTLGAALTPMTSTDDRPVAVRG